MQEANRLQIRIIKGSADLFDTPFTSVFLLVRVFFVCELLFQQGVCFFNKFVFAGGAYYFVDYFAIFEK